MEEVVISGDHRCGTRTIGGYQRVFSGVGAAELGGTAIAAAIAAAGVGHERIEELQMGCVLRAGQGRAPARQTGFKAGLGEEVPATTLNKMFSSGMKAAMAAHDQIALGQTAMMVASGMESMTEASYLLPKLRDGARIGHGQVIDHMFLDGLEDAYDKGRLMGTFAEDRAERYQFTRADQDDYALGSLSNALAAKGSTAVIRMISSRWQRQRRWSRA